MTDIYSVQNFVLKHAVGRLVFKARHLLIRRIGERLVALDLASAQWGVVVALAEGVASTPAELSRALDYDQGAMTRVIDRLEEKNIVSRTRSVGDRRSIGLELTDRGRALFPQILPLIVAAHNELLTGFSKEEANQLESFLNRMLENE